MNQSPAEALLALGGNIGDVRVTFERAIAMLCADGAVRLLARSSDYRTPPWGVTDQPAFINAAIVVATSLDPHELLVRVQTVERALGRDRTRERRWGPRRIDIDILAYDDVVLREADLTLPHPHLFFCRLLKLRPTEPSSGNGLAMCLLVRMWRASRSCRQGKPTRDAEAPH